MEFKSFLEWAKESDIGRQPMEYKYFSEWAKENDIVIKDAGLIWRIEEFERLYFRYGDQPALSGAWAREDLDLMHAYVAYVYSFIKKDKAYYTQLSSSYLKKIKEEVTYGI